MTEAQREAVEAARCLLCKEVQRLFEEQRLCERHGLTAAYGLHRARYQQAVAHRRALDDLLWASEEKAA